MIVKSAVQILIDINTEAACPEGIKGTIARSQSMSSEIMRECIKGGSHTLVFRVFC